MCDHCITVEDKATTDAHHLKTDEWIILWHNISKVKNSFQHLSRTISNVVSTALCPLWKEGDEKHFLSKCPALHDYTICVSDMFSRCWMLHSNCCLHSLRISFGQQDPIWCMLSRVQNHLWFQNCLESVITCCHSSHFTCLSPWKWPEVRTNNLSFVRSYWSMRRLRERWIVSSELCLVQVQELGQILINALFSETFFLVWFILAVECTVHGNHIGIWYRYNVKPVFSTVTAITCNCSQMIVLVCLDKPMYAPLLRCDRHAGFLGDVYLHAVSATPNLF